MPWIATGNFEVAEHYEIDKSARAITPTKDDVDWSIARKKELARLKDDGTLPKDIRREHGKLYRGFCHLVYYIAAWPPGDCKKEMTKEIAPYADVAWLEFYCR